MKRMAMLDFITMRRNLLSTVGISVAISVFMTVSMGTTIVAAGAVAALIPYMFINNVFAYDELDGWEKMRLSMPLARRDVVLGRYASVLAMLLLGFVLAALLGTVLAPLAGVLPGREDAMAGQLATFGENAPFAAGAAGLCCIGMLPAFSILMPVLVRFGVTKGTRVVILVFVMVLCFGIGTLANLAGEGALAPAGLAEIATSVPLPATMAIAAVVALAMYAASAAISVRLYATKEL